MEMERWEPWREFERLQRRLCEMLDEFFAGSHMQALPRKPDFSPVIDMYESVRGLVLRAALPGILEEDIDVTFEEDSVIIRGESGPPLDVVEGGQKLQELRYGYFERRVLLPEGYNTAKASLEIHSGVLEVRLPKTQHGEI